MNRREMLKQSSLAVAASALPVEAGARSPDAALRAYTWVETGYCCTARNVEDARRLFEQKYFEVLSPKDFVETPANDMQQIHFEGFREAPDRHCTFAEELKLRISRGDTEAQLLWNTESLATPPAPRPCNGWTRVRHGEYTPPAGQIVWTTDDRSVRRGAWHPSEPLAFNASGWQEGEWRDRFGDKIDGVTRWEFDDGGWTPAPPLASPGPLA